MPSEIEIPKDGYLAFDAMTMKRLITESLDWSGVFTDQNYEASYLSNFINIIAYAYGSLLFYLNKTSSESTFTEAQIYENMNRIVKMIDYNPVGFQTSLLPFKLTAQGIPSGLHVIPRFSYFINDGVTYSFNEDIVFNKTIDDEAELIQEVSRNKVLYQGRFFEHPSFTSIGEEKETFNFRVASDILVDHFNIFIYRYNVVDGVWEEWTKTDNLFLESSAAKRYEIRLTPDQNYEIKFGDGINGAKLNQGDKITVYYLQSDGEDGEISAGGIDDGTFVRFFTPRFSEIFEDTKTTSASLITNPSSLSVANTAPSSRSKIGETPDEIRSSAPGVFKSQYRLVTSEDYKVFIQNNFANFIQDVNVYDNWEYISSYLKYYCDLGLSRPDLVNAPMFAQVMFSDSCNFNNVYITAVPRTNIYDINNAPTLSVSQKQQIIDEINLRKTITTETVILDPIYIAIDFAIPKTRHAPSISDIEYTELVVVKDDHTRRAQDDIRADISQIFKDAFNQRKLKLGSTIRPTLIYEQILRVTGVKDVYMRRADTHDRASGLSFYVFDPVYPAGLKTSITEIKLTDFQFAFYNKIDSIVNRIQFDTPSNFFETTGNR